MRVNGEERYLVKMFDIEQLRFRVMKFQKLELPGQPQGMHMGTSYLVNDLMKAIEEMWAEKENKNDEEAVRKT